MRSTLVAEVLSGATYVSVAQEFGVAISTAWRWVQTDAAEPPVRQLTPAQKSKIRTAIDGGQHSLRQIARLHDVHISTVCAIRDEMAVGGHRAKPARCRECGGLIQTQVCLRCECNALSVREAVQGAVQGCVA